MTTSVEDRSPEVTGLLAAKHGLAVVEAAFMPASLLVRPAALWIVAVVSVSTLATAAGVMVAGDLPVAAAVQEQPIVAAMISPVSDAQPAAPAAAAENLTAPPKERALPTKKPRPQPVVLRGQPAKTGQRSPSALLSVEEVLMAASGRSGRSN